MELLHQLADEIHEAFSERGHKIETAVQADPAFRRTKVPQSSMARGMVLHAIDCSVGRLGLQTIGCAGGGYDVQELGGTVDRRFRVRKAEKDPDTSEYEILVRRGVSRFT